MDHSLCDTVLLAGVPNHRDAITAVFAKYNRLFFFTLDVCCKHGSSLSLALQLHRIQQQEILRPISLLCFRGMYFYHFAFWIFLIFPLQSVQNCTKKDDRKVIYYFFVGVYYE